MQSIYESMRIVLLLFGAPASLLSMAAEPKPAEIDPLLRTVASTGYHRFLEYRLCSPEHCWSDAYLQWWDLGADTASILVTLQVKELGYGTAVVSATWRWEASEPHLEVEVNPSHGGFEPYTLVIIPGSPGEYEANRH